MSYQKKTNSTYLMPKQLDNSFHLGSLYKFLKRFTDLIQIIIIDQLLNKQHNAFISKRWQRYIYYLFNFNYPINSWYVFHER